MSGKGFPSDIPPCAIRALAKRFEDGAAKYQRNNWMQGIPMSRYFDAMMRHLMQWHEGDTTEDHAGAVLWNAACALWTEQGITTGRLDPLLMDLPFRASAKRKTARRPRR